MYRSQEQIRMWTIAIAMCILFTIDGSHTSSIAPILPCNFYDSINITDGQYGPDGVIVYDGLTYTPNQYAKVNYIWENGKTKIMAHEHIRGCICNIKKCIRTCCPYGKVWNSDVKQCESHEFTKDYNHLILNEMNEIEEVALNEHFSLVNDRPCEAFYEVENYTILHVSLHAVSHFVWFLGYPRLENFDLIDCFSIYMYRPAKWIWIMKNFIIASIAFKRCSTKKQTQRNWVCWCVLVLQK